MKNQLLYFGGFLVLFGISCNQDHNTLCKGAQYELHPPNLHDTVNVVDCNGLKQGKWIPSTTNDLKDTVYYLDGVIKK